MVCMLQKRIDAHILCAEIPVFEFKISIIADDRVLLSFFVRLVDREIHLDISGSSVSSLVLAFANFLAVNVRIKSCAHSKLNVALVLQYKRCHTPIRHNAVAVSKNQAVSFSAQRRCNNALRLAFFQFFRRVHNGNQCCGEPRRRSLVWHGLCNHLLHGV